MPDAAPQKFGFDTWFDDDGRIMSEAPAARVRRAYSAAEVEAVRQQAFLDGQADQRGRDESATAQALAQISQACAQALEQLDEVVAGYRSQCADLAMATGEALAEAALEQFPRAPLMAALEALSDEVAGAGRLTIRVAADSNQTQSAIQKAAEETGLAGRILIRHEPDAAAAAFIVEWPDGRAEYDPAAIAQRVRAALQSALSAETDCGADFSNGEP